MDATKIKLPYIAPLKKLIPTAEFSHPNDPTKVFRAEKIKNVIEIPIPMPYNNAQEN